MKITKDYQVKISELLKKNEDLSVEVEDLISSLRMNDEVICNYLPNTEQFEEVHSDLCHYLSRYINLIYEKSEIQNNIEYIDKVNKELPELISRLKDENEDLKKELKLTLRNIYLDYKIIMKIRKNSGFKAPQEEKFIINPTKKSLELYLINKEININKYNNEKKESNFNISEEELQLLKNRIEIIDEQIKIAKNNNKESDNDISIKIGANNHENSIIDGLKSSRIYEEDTEKNMKKIDNLYYYELNKNLQRRKSSANKFLHRTKSKKKESEFDIKKIISKDDNYSTQLEKYVQKIEEIHKENFTIEQRVNELQNKYKNKKNKVLDLVTKINFLKNEINNMLS